MKIKIKIPLHLKAPFVSSGVITGVLFVLALVSFFTTQPEIPIFYSLGAKSEWLAPKIWIFIFPVLSLATTVIHFLFLSLNKSLEKIITQLFAWATIIVQVVLALSFIRIIYIIS